MSEKDETIADVVAWFRTPQAGENGYLTAWREEIADRIEAAAKRMEVMHNREMEHYKQERNEAPAKERKRLRDNGFLIIPSAEFVNLRKALKDLVEVIDKCDINSPLWWHCGAKGVEPLSRARAALALLTDSPENDNSAAANITPCKYGNAAKLREALILVQKKINFLIGSLTVPNSLVANRMEINGIINAALAVPSRNCDVGTAEEQAIRYGQYCDTYLRDDGSKPCTGCPCCGKIPFGMCEFAWAQMPYESEAK